MMVEAITLLLRQLNGHIASIDAASTVQTQAVWGNIAQLDRPEIATDLENHLVLSLVNVEEERTLRNGRVTTDSGAQEVTYTNRPLHLNLFLLFTANYRNYETALKRLAQVLMFFQGKQRFTFGNSPGGSAPIAELSLAMDLLSLTFEEANHLWGFLGGKQIPFALYRGRLIVVSDKRAIEGGGVVTDVDVIGRAVPA